MQREVNRKTVMYGVSIVLLAVILTAICCIFEVQAQLMRRPTTLKTFSSYGELRSFLSKVRSPYGGWMWYGLFAEASSVLKAAPVSTLIPEHSTTNIQVAGVDESDVVKTDGNYIYMISEGRIVIVRAYPAEEAEVSSTIELNGTAIDLFINGDRLVVFESSNFIGWNLETEISVKVYDVSDRRTPILKRDVSLNGWYFGSRMIRDYVYVIVNSPAIRLHWNETTVNLPEIRIGDHVERISATEIRYVDFESYFNTFTTIVAINIYDDEEKLFHETILTGPATCMYVSPSNIYIAISKVPECIISPFATAKATRESTLIIKIRIDAGEITCEANGEVPGRVLNQFSMDEYNGYFRIATTTGYLARISKEATARNHIYILDGNLKIVGMLEGLAPGEHIHSARFIGDRCYMVTFRKVDPLFVIDVSNPETPKVLGKLKIPGYSDYLHPYDREHLIGIGKETVPAEERDFSWYQGVKISLFDVSNVEKPKELDKFVIGGRGTETPVLHDHKALLFDGKRRLLVLPVLVAEIDGEKYLRGYPPYMPGDYVFQGAYVFNVSEGGITYRGRITHIQGEDLAKSGWNFYSPYSVKRALYIDGILYTISDKKIKMNSLEDLKLINELEIP
ncbi:hypothetical protein CW706_00460 [Candidatus Bathyarchaeota archaeon]|nr:MAG: hypothetical protein CW706_00460 [Candidatus Bathyarchaeota archaeon]